MHALSKISFAFLYLAICMVAYGADINSVPPLIPQDTLPQDFNKLSAEAKADILCGVTESSYRVLVKVPEKGLRDSHDLLKQIISARKWLEETGDSVARLLSMDLQYGVDSCILNEMYREEIKKHSRALKYPFKKDSFDNTLIKTLLNENAIDEYEYINYALSLDTDIAKFCRENNYDANDFLSGRVFDEAEDQMVISLTATHNGEKIQVLEKTDIRDANLLFMIIWTGYEMRSRKEIEIFLLSETLRRIDEARAARLLARIYHKHNGFAKSVSSKRSIIESNSLNSRVVDELPKGRGKTVRLTTRRYKYFTDYRGPEARSIRGRMNALEDEFSQEDWFEIILALLLRPFIRNSDVLPSRYQPKPDYRSGYMTGMWLNLSD